MLNVLLISLLVSVSYMKETKLVLEGVCYSMSFDSEDNMKEIVAFTLPFYNKQSDSIIYINLDCRRGQTEIVCEQVGVRVNKNETRLSIFNPSTFTGKPIRVIKHKGVLVIQTSLINTFFIYKDYIGLEIKPIFSKNHPPEMSIGVCPAE